MGLPAGLILLEDSCAASSGPSHKILSQLLAGCHCFPTLTLPTYTTKPSPDALNPSFIAHSSVVLQKSQSLRNFLRRLKRHCRVPWEEHSVCAGASLRFLTQGWRTSLAAMPWPLSSQAIRTGDPLAHSQELERVSRSSRRVGLSVPVLSDYSLGWQQGIPRPEGMFEVTRGGWAGTSGLKSQWQTCPGLWHSWARPCPQWVLPQPPSPDMNQSAHEASCPLASAE